MVVPLRGDEVGHDSGQGKNMLIRFCRVSIAMVMAFGLGDGPFERLPAQVGSTSGTTDSRRMASYGRQTI